MLKVLLIGIVLSASVDDDSPSSLQSPDSGRAVVVGSDLKRSLSYVFVGTADDMPRDEGFIMNISPRLDPVGQILVPETSLEAIQIMYESLPAWYIEALRSSDECQVLVNGIPYDFYVLTWFASHWKFNDPASLLISELRAYGVPDAIGHVAHLSALWDGLCEYTTSGNLQTAHEAVRNYAKEYTGAWDIPE